MTVYQLICLCGGQAAVTLLVERLFAWIGKRRRRDSAEGDAIREGVQMALAAEMKTLYARCADRGCAAPDERELFESAYKAYHALGGNGIMTDTRAKLLALPIRKEEAWTGNGN